MADREKGKVKWFSNSKGYGFIEREQGTDVFVHFSSIQGEGYRSLLEGQDVEFSLKAGEKGLHADEVISYKSTMDTSFPPSKQSNSSKPGI